MLMSKTRVELSGVKCIAELPARGASPVELEGCSPVGEEKGMEEKKVYR